MAIQIETAGNGVLFNGALTDKQGWVLSASSDQTKVVLTNRITGLSSSSAVAEVEVDGSTFADYDALVAALGSVLFKNGGGAPSEGVQGVTGDGVDNTDPENPVISYPTPGDIGAATAAQGELAETALQPGDVPAAPTWTTISGKPAFVAEGANAAAARTALGLGTAATQASGAFATAAQGAKADTAVQSAQEGGVGVLVSNIIQVTQAEYDGLTPQAGTFYAIVG